ncbi:MAG: hypothetical protein HY695_11340 [Deltaproteobacteria bacterium]|nr:hypothetical protein [Deltaproteobacteria bacterium]
MSAKRVKFLLALGLVGALGLASSATAQDRDRSSREGPGYGESRERTDASRYSERARKSDWERGKQELARALKMGEEKNFYRRELEKMGYQITATNYDKADYVEYEVVKGDQTWEVQIDLDKDSHKAKKVEISTNMWQAENTDRALKGKKASSRQTTRGNVRYSDRDRSKDWDRGKDELARVLKTGEERDSYRRQLEKMGYQITSVNSDKPDYVEYEVVKGDQTYEIQIDFDKNSRKANKVDVTTNMWKAEATERALASKEDKRKVSAPESRHESRPESRR